MPRVSVNVGYNRRWFRNFFVTDNTVTTAADYEKCTVAVPQNPLLPGGRRAPPPTSTSRPLPRHAAHRTTRRSRPTTRRPARSTWHGVNANVTARLRFGLTLQGGTTTGRGVQDTCDLNAALPELLFVHNVNQRLDSCDVVEPWMTTFRGAGRLHGAEDRRLVSANMRSVPGASLGTGSISATNGTRRTPTTTCPTRRPAVARPAAGQRPRQRHDQRQHAQPRPAVRRADHAGRHAVRQDGAVQAGRAPTSASTSTTCSTRTRRRRSCRRTTTRPAARPTCGRPRSWRRGSRGSTSPSRSDHGRFS